MGREWWAGRRMEVDGIVSQADIEDCVAIEPMFRIIDVEHGAAAHLRCSRPYSPDDERRWLRGDEDIDLDRAQHWV